MPHKPNNELHRLVIDRGLSMRDISIKLEFKQATSFRNVLIKREFDSKPNQMSVTKWAALGKILNIGLTELMELYNTEAK